MALEIQQLLSKIATNEQHGENSPYFDGWKAYENDPFHPMKNPEGIIQMGLAENQLSCDLIEEWIRKNPEASICSKKGLNRFKEIANFQDYHGLPEFRKAVARFMGKIRGDRVSFDPDRIVMAGGATGASELLMFCLADPGDAFLVPTPYYPAFDRDLKWRTGVQLIPVICLSSNNFKITKEALDDACENARKSNVRVKGVIVANPSNPLGTIFDLDTQKLLLKFINDRQIHLVCDEIYFATVFTGDPNNGRNFISIAEVIEGVENRNIINRDLIHIIYSLSKDMGVPGFRVGIMYSYNAAVVQCGRKMSSFGLVSSQTQQLLASMLSDDEFIHHFLAQNSERLSRRHAKFTNGLREDGITCLSSNAGLFCWMDLRTLLKKPTFDGEMLLWRVIINQVKLNVSPGFSFHCNEPGWFRVCFANMDEETLELALQRIRNFMENLKRKEEWRRNLSGLTLKSSSSSSSSSAAARRLDPNDQIGLKTSSPRTSSNGIMSSHSPVSPSQPVN